MKVFSLKNKILFHFSIPLLLTIALVTGLIFFFVRIEIEKLYDSQMEQFAHTLLVLTRHEAIEGEDINKTLNPENQKLTSPEGPLIAYRIWNENNLVLQSQEAKILGEKTKVEGFSEVDIGPDEWRIFTITSHDDRISIEVAQKCWPRIFLIFKIFKSLILPFSILILILIWIVDFSLKRAFFPFNQISRDLNARNVNDLNPLASATIPKEIVSVSNALNRLFLRLRESIDREREFTDNAAHELRTPLAALKVRAQILSKKIEKLGIDVEDNLNELLSSIDRTIRVVEQMLELTRYQQGGGNFFKINLSEIIDKEKETLSLNAISKNQKIKFSLQPDLEIYGNAGALSILLRNLVDNAVRYSQKGAEILIQTARENESIILQLIDTGPGIENSKKERVFERFLRLNVTETGSGLGLSIVKSICDSHGAHIHLSDNVPNGLIVSIIFPENKKR